MTTAIKNSAARCGRDLVQIMVSTEFHVDGIPYTVVSSVNSVCYTELPKIPRNYTEFCVTYRVSTEVTFWNSA
jgi:hypothetical protein